MHRSFLTDACLSCSSRPSKEEPTPSPGHVFQCLTSIIARKIFFLCGHFNASLLLFHSFSYSPYHTQVLQEQTIALVRFEKLPRLDSFQRDHGNCFLTAHDPTCSQVSASQPNQNHRCSRASNFHCDTYHQILRAKLATHASTASVPPAFTVAYPAKRKTS